MIRGVGFLKKCCSFVLWLLNGIDLLHAIDRVLFADISNRLKEYIGDSFVFVHVRSKNKHEQNFHFDQWIFPFCRSLSSLEMIGSRLDS